MKYRAILIDPSDPELKVRALQIFSKSRDVLNNWIKDVLSGRKPPAKVEVYERQEVLVDTVVPEIPPETPPETPVVEK